LSEERYRSVVDNSPYGIYRVTHDGRFITLNPALCAMLGYTADELYAGGIGILYESLEQRSRLLQDLLSRPIGKPVEVPWLRKDGTTIVTRAWVYADRDESGHITYLDGYVEDVTPLREAEQALRQAEKLAAIGTVISGVAHELNNPLAAILLFAEDLLTTERPDDEREALGIITQQARRSRAIVRDLLTFVRRRDVSRSAVCPQMLFEQIGRALEPQIDVRGVVLHFAVSATEAIHVDPVGIEQVVSNLVTNAAQATGEGGNVWTHAFQEPGAFVIEVLDDGPGIPPSVLPRMFEPFYTTKPLGQGTGLGLSVTAGIVEQHGGTIVAGNRDARDGGGARVVVRLPSPARAHPVGDSDGHSEELRDSILVA